MSVRFWWWHTDLVYTKDHGGEGLVFRWLLRFRWYRWLYHLTDTKAERELRQEHGTSDEDPVP